MERLGRRVVGFGREARATRAKKQIPRCARDDSVRLLRVRPKTGPRTPCRTLKEGDRIAAACLIPESEENGGEEEKPPLIQ